MIDDPVAVREICRSFEKSAAEIGGPLAARRIAELEAAFGRRVAALAKALGWRSGVRVRLRPIDYPRVGAFPPRGHQSAARIRLRGVDDAELWLNSNVLDIADAPALLDRLPVFLWVFGSLLERHPETAGDFRLYTGDACLWNAVASSANHPDACVVPDPDYFKTGGFADFRVATETVPHWESRRGVVHWRGSTSGIKRYWPPAAPDDVGWLPRLQLCARAQSGVLAASCDIGFTSLVQVPLADRPRLEAALAPLWRAPVDKLEAARFKAVIDIDGNSNTWSSGLYCSLLAGACVIKVSSEHGFRQWYYDRLEPWVHYVPVRADFSDLEEKVRRVMTDDDFARSVGRAGRRLARSMHFAGELATTVDRLSAWTSANAVRAATFAIAPRGGIERGRRRPRDVIFVAGMGRSGTSALARVLALCGGALPLELLPPNFANDAGYWEPVQAIGLNDAFLEAHGSSWYDGSLALQTGLVGAVEREDFIAEIAEFLRTAFEPHGPLVLKEPRISALLPYWKAAVTAVGFRATFVHVFREPGEVAASLADRDGLSVPHSHALWLKYNLSAERDARHAPRVFVSYDRLMNDWAGVVPRCISELSLDLTVTGAQSTISEFLTPALRHHHTTPERAGAAADGLRADWVARLYALLREAERGRIREAEFDAIRAGYVDSGEAAEYVLVRAVRPDLRDRRPAERVP